MTKIFAFVAAVLCVLVGVAQAQNATVTKPPCGVANFSAKASEFKALTNLLSFVVTNKVLSSQVPAVIAVNNSAVAPVPFKLLNLNFELTPTIKDLKLAGVQNLVPKYVNATSPNTLVARLDFNGSLALNATISVSIQQLDLKWYSTCWTDAIHTPFTCPPAVFDVDVSIVMEKPGAVIDAQLDLAGCAPGVPRTVCKDVTVSDIMIAALNQKFDTLLPRLLRRFKGVTVRGVQLGWDSISELDVMIKQTGKLIDSLLDKLVDFSVAKVNEKGDIYSTVIDVVQKLAVSTVNKLFASLAPQFGNTCYDP